MPSYRVISTQQQAEWDRLVDGISKKSLVHLARYTRIYERYGDGKGECFVFNGEQGVVVYPFLRRAIDIAPGFTDTITPYGYGGPVYECRDGFNPADLIAGFRSAFETYARDTRTVSEFVRFHPFLANHVHFAGLIDDLSLHCVNALEDLAIGADALFRQYRASYQQCIRKAFASGLQVVQLASPDFFDPFFALYSASMQRKHQVGYLKFRRDFLVDLSEEIPNELKCFAVKHDGRAVAIALFLHHSDYLDYFLAASDPAALPLHPNHLLLHRVALWAIENGVKWFHLGGGHKSLQFFKHGFANRSCDYYLGKHVIDKDVYQRLSSEHWARHGQTWSPGGAFFPGYRAEFEAS